MLLLISGGKCHACLPVYPNNRASWAEGRVEKGGGEGRRQWPHHKTLTGASMFEGKGRLSEDMREREGGVGGGGQTRTQADSEPQLERKKERRGGGVTQIEKVRHKHTQKNGKKKKRNKAIKTSR